MGPPFLFEVVSQLKLGLRKYSGFFSPSSRPTVAAEGRPGADRPGLEGTGHGRRQIGSFPSAGLLRGVADGPCHPSALHTVGCFYNYEA